MSVFSRQCGWLLLGLMLLPARGEVVLKTTSRYHQIEVVDEAGFRTLSFDGSMETRVSLADPLQGHFEYTEFFQMPFLLNDAVTNVLMIGLGGGSTQRACLHYHPQVRIESVEIDPVVVRIAREYFQVGATNRHKILVEDGRLYLRRSRQTYDVIILDAYVQNRYGSSIPYHLATKEFFEIARDRLSRDGMLAYNVIGNVRGWRADLLAALYQTLKAVFPQVYLFPSVESQNVVLLATRSAREYSNMLLHQKLTALQKAGHRFPPRFRDRINQFRRIAPSAAYRAPVLTDDFAPIEGLMRTE